LVLLYNYLVELLRRQQDSAGYSILYQDDAKELFICLSDYCVGFM